MIKFLELELVLKCVSCLSVPKKILNFEYKLDNGLCPF